MANKKPRAKVGGRKAGTPNKRTLQLHALLQDGETPCAFALRIMRDEAMELDLRLHAAKLAAPFLHSKPNPQPRTISFALPEAMETTRDLLTIHAAILQATASGTLPLDEAKELSAILETHRRLVETTDLETRLAALERKQP